MENRRAGGAGAALRGLPGGVGPEAVLEGPDGELRPRGEAQPGVDGAQVPHGGGLRDRQRPRDGAVAQPATSAATSRTRGVSGPARASNASPDSGAGAKE